MLGLGLSFKVRISVLYTLNACKNIKLKLKQTPKNNFKNNTPNITNMQKHVKNTQQRIIISMLGLGLKNMTNITYHN